MSGASLLFNLTINQRKKLMKIVPIHRFNAFLSPTSTEHGSWADWLEPFFGASPLPEAAGEVLPVVHIHEDAATGYVVQVELPGVKKEDVKVELEANQLVVSATRKVRGVAGAEETVQYRRGFTLPEDADGEAITAALQDGILTLGIVRAKENQLRRQIAVA